MGDREYMFDDDLKQIARQSMGFGDRGGGGGAAPLTTSFAHLSQGKTIGKKVNILRKTGVTDAVSAINILEVRGSDDFAQTLGVTFIPPQVIPLTSVPAGLSVQDVSMGESNLGSLGGAGFVPSGLPAAFIWDQLIGIIEWGIGGINNMAIVDIMNGINVNVYASFLRLRAVVGLISGVTEAVYLVGAFAGPAHSCPSHGQFTDRYGLVNAGADGSVRAIPWFAKNITILADTVDNIFDVRFFQDQAAAVEVGRYAISTAAAGNVLPGTKLPIPGAGAYFYRIHNGSGNAQHYRAIFDLAI